MCFRATEGDLAYEPKGAVMTPFQSLNTRLQAFAVLSERGPLRLEELATELEQRGGSCDADWRACARRSIEVLIERTCRVRWPSTRTTATSGTTKSGSRRS